jgi:hypothetical protein
MKNPAEHLTPAELKALKITSTFETGQPLDFGGLAGNFDKQGLSFGILQWNIKSGTLQPLLKEFINLSPAKFAEIFDDDSKAFKNLIFDKTLKDQMQFALSINDSKNRIIEPWKSYFAKLGNDPDMRSIQIRVAKTRLLIATGQMSELGFHTERAFVFLFDIVTQHGPNWLKVKKRRQIISAKLAKLSDNDEKAIMRVIADVLSSTVKPAFAKNVRERRNVIIEGRGHIGKRHFDIEADYGLGDDIIRS